MIPFECIIPKGHAMQSWDVIDIVHFELDRLRAFVSEKFIGVGYHSSSVNQFNNTSLGITYDGTRELLVNSMHAEHNPERLMVLMRRYCTRDSSLGGVVIRFNDVTAIGVPLLRMDIRCYVDPGKSVVPGVSICRE